MSFQSKHVLSFVMVGSLSLLPLTAQTAAKPATAGKASTGRAYVAPRTPDGQPDLQGIWDTATLTPLERPAALGTKAYYTKEEADAYEAGRSKEMNRDRRDGTAQNDLDRAYNDGWFDRGAHLGRTLRTSRIVDPPDGRFPALTREAKKKYDEFHAWFKEHPADNPEDRPLFDRCLFFSQSGPPLVPGNYNNNYQIIQTPGMVTIYSEMGHQARNIPLSNIAAKLPAGVAQWMGDSRGHWEGETLVVESSNFRFNSQSHFGTQYDGMTDENLRVVERFTRTAPDLIVYQATVTDPTVYSKPWTIELPMSKTNSPIYEYACHEGNYGMSGILSGERARDKALESKQTSKK